MEGTQKSWKFQRYPRILVIRFKLGAKISEVVIGATFSLPFGSSRPITIPHRSEVMESYNFCRVHIVKRCCRWIQKSLFFYTYFNILLHFHNKNLGKIIEMLLPFRLLYLKLLNFRLLFFYAICLLKKNVYSKTAH